MDMNKSNLFVLKTLFNVDTISFETIEKFKEALLFFTVPHSHMDKNNNVEIYGKSFRIYQMNYIAGNKGNSIFEYIFSLIHKKLKIDLKPRIQLLNESKIFEQNRELVVTLDSIFDFTKSCKLSATLLDTITTWATSGEDRILILPITEKLKTDSESDFSHATILIIKKRSEVKPFFTWDSEPGAAVRKYFEIFYFNSHGVNSCTTSRAIKRELTKVLRPFDVEERTLTSDCPSFQTSYQGGNCSTWQRLFMICILTHPHLLDSPEKFEKFLGASADVNILIFELYVFFVGMFIIPFYVEKIVHEYNWGDTENTNKYFNDMLEVELGIENCESNSKQHPFECTNIEHCQFFKGKCWFKAMNTRRNLFYNLVNSYQYFVSQGLLPDSQNIINSYTRIFVEDYNYFPPPWDVDENDQGNPRHFWVEDALYPELRKDSFTSDDEETENDSPTSNLGKRKREIL